MALVSRARTTTYQRDKNNQSNVLSSVMLPFACVYYVPSGSPLTSIESEEELLRKDLNRRTCVEYLAAREELQYFFGIVL